MFSGAKKKNQGNVGGNTNRRLLVVDVLEARNIIAVDPKKNSSDSYVVCSLLDLGDREIKSETFTTQQVKGTVNPSYNQKLSFGNVYDLDTKYELPSIKFSIYHKGLFTVSETPLGEVVIPLQDIDPNCASTELWYPLKKAGRMAKVSGEIHLKLAFSKPITGAEVTTGTPGDVEAGETEGLLDENNDDPDAAEVTPNELIINIIQARGLPIMDKNLLGSGGSSDPFARVRIPGFEDKSTGYIEKTLNPVWNEKIVYPFVTEEHMSLSMQVSVYDFNTFQLKKFMGRLQIPLLEFADKKPRKKWYKLQAKEENDGADRGEIELSIVWRWSAEINQKIRIQEEKSKNSILGKVGRTLNRAANALTGDVNDDDMDVAEEGGGGVDPNDVPETPEEAEKRKKEEEEKMKEIADIDIKSGDYTVQVHIIEARDLKAENLDGTSDPVCFVELFGQKQNTSTKYGQTSCVFDELLIFSFRNMDKEQFSEGLIRISVKDANMNPFGKKKMIGSVAYDASAIYTQNKEHEMYRQWVALMDDEDSDDVGVQGYLKISVAIIGPGEKMKVHNEDEDIAKEIAAETSVGGDVGSLVLSVPSIRKEWKFVVVSIYRAETLPVMDGKIGLGYAKLKSAGTDAFCGVTMGGAKMLRTKAVTVQGDNRLAINPIFNYELWFPVSVPSTTSMIKFSVWDEDEIKNEMIGQVYESLTAITKTPNGSLDVRWYNIYGKPEFKTEKLLENVAKVAKAAGKAATNVVKSGIDYETLYNNVPDKASTFKGRILARFRVVSSSNRPAKFNTTEIKPFKLRIPKDLKPKEPPTTEYILKGLIVVGNQMPSFGILSQELKVKICVGAVELTTKSAQCESNTYRWNELIRSDPFKLPTDLKQLPDIFVYIVRSDSKPVCFTRLKSTIVSEDGELKTLGFEHAAKWFLLQEDKVINALNDDEFPGTLLLKLGFGRVDEATNSKAEWDTAISDIKSTVPYQIRVHLYQARNLPAIDSNGLADPFVKVSFLSMKEKSAVRHKTLFPEYYQTFVLNDVTIPEAENFLYAPLVSFRVFDKDNFDADDYIGTCTFSLQDAFKTDDPDADLPDPVWTPLFRELPGDGQGELLISVQLIPSLNTPFKDKLLSPPRSIVPETRDAFVDFIAVGIRDMAPFHFQPMNSPFLEIEMSSMGTLYSAATAPSKRPNPSNPNFLQQLTLPCKLPVKSIYASPLQLRARDVRLGGYSKPVVGVGAIDLTTKLPWCPETYKAPQTDMFYQGTGDINFGAAQKDELDESNLDEVGKEVLRLEQERIDQVAHDDFIALAEPPKIDDLLKKRVLVEDTGAGVFGALNHITLDGKKKKKGENVFVDPDWTQDDGDQPPEWSINRKVLDNELEEVLKTTPFETYPLTRGKLHGLLGNTFKVVGRFKGLVRVIEDKDEPPLFSKELMDQLFKPKGYKVRLYVLKGVGLTPMDHDMFGRPSPSDPYLKVKLGKAVFDDRENAVDDATDVDFYKMIEFDAELPGTSQLNISVMDKNDFHSDKLIGSTTIDLEDRWFDARWQEEGDSNKRLPSDLKEGATLKPRWQTKPIERRSLYVPSNRAPQGVVECWVDIMTPEVANIFEPDDVRLPPSQVFQVRVVIWKSKNVPAMDSFEGMSDLFLKCWPEGCPVQETDTHWRCKKGKASWNYRLLFDVELGHSTKAMKFPYLHLQLWDRDLLKWNDCAGEVTINLGRYYRKAFKRGVTLKLFETKKGAAGKRAQKKTTELEEKKIEVLDDEEDIPPDEVEPQNSKTADYDNVNDPVNNPLTTPANVGSGFEEKKGEDSDDDDVEGADTGLGAVTLKDQVEISKKGLSTHIEGKGNTKIVRKAKAGEATTKGAKPVETKKWYSVLLFWQKTPEQKEKDELEMKPLLDEDALEEGKTEEDRQKEQDEEETKGFIDMIKNMTGLWDVDPEDSDWAHFEQHDHNTGKSSPMGSVAYSVQIWPKNKADLFPVGSARTEPNTNPFLPPPVGRLKFSWNPFVMGAALCGPKICSMVFCCLLCAVFIVLMIFCQPFLNIIINIVFLVIR